MGLFGYLAVIAGVAELVFAAFVFAFVKRLMGRPSTPVSEEVGGTRRALKKLRKGEPMSEEEFDCAAQTIAERSSLMAFSIPAAVFTIGCFIVFSTIELHSIKSLRIYIGLFPMLGSINLTVQLLRVVALKRRLPNAAELSGAVDQVKAGVAERNRWNCCCATLARRTWLTGRDSR